MTDDQVNVCILIAALLFAAVAFPSALRYDDDARLGDAVREMMP